MPVILEERARLIAASIALLLGAWMLHSFLAMLAWALVLAITTWPVYTRLTDNPSRSGGVWAALALTLLIGGIILVPLGFGLARLLQEANALGTVLGDIQNIGVPAPVWLVKLPLIGNWANDTWNTMLGTPQAANDTLHWLGTGGAVQYTKDLAGQIVHRIFGFLITLLVLFFVYLYGENLGRQVFASTRKFFGETGIRYIDHAIAAMRGTVNGLVLVSLGEGLLLGVGYAFAGLGHPAILGALTGVFAMVPFAAKIIVVVCALVLVGQGQVAAGSVLFIFGVAVILLADNYVRPALIGGAVKLPFLWTMLGIFGGLENFGLLGLFLGPTLMAVLISIWRDWIEDIERKEPPNVSAA